MQRTIRTERVYSLAPYNTFRTEDIISDVPDSLMFNNDYIKKIKFLQLVELELQYYKYEELCKILETLPEKERVDYLKSIKNTLTEELYKSLFDRAEK